jgi:hypothetical protein
MSAYGPSQYLASAVQNGRSERSGLNSADSANSGHVTHSGTAPAASVRLQATQAHGGQATDHMTIPGGGGNMVVGRVPGGGLSWPDDDQVLACTMASGGGGGRSGGGSSCHGDADVVDRSDGSSARAEANGASARQRANLAESWDMALEDETAASRWVRGNMLARIGSEVRADMLASVNNEHHLLSPWCNSSLVSSLS